MGTAGEALVVSPEKTATTGAVQGQLFLQHQLAEEVGEALAALGGRRTRSSAAAEQLGGGERATCGAEVRVGQLRAGGSDVKVACEEVREGEGERVGQLAGRRSSAAGWGCRQASQD